ncbi:Edem2-PA, variant 1 [Capsaspora owczarzaki ATCC 30864]|uniref:alpha-1,2-Mannosidase n=1 Tax=Capsaspora owczarzaki (strain ATCC 30864) TaxID=595528 RepID=A0A0D2VXJ3_CAPO3|nr:Edem2-PA, variant 1 [Capsaspora owczarzaki ATCC 30864]
MSTPLRVLLALAVIAWIAWPTRPAQSSAANANGSAVRGKQPPLPSSPASEITPAMQRELRDAAKEMFYHGFNSYMKYAYPADELMPLSCTGRVRGVTPNRGDMDDALGRFALTLVDSMDTLAVMGDYDEFMWAVAKVALDIRLDADVVVSVFETNIRMVGGLISAHVLALEIANRRLGRSPHTYNGRLLAMAYDLGTRLLPAFDTPTGIPYARVNLRFGMTKEALKDHSTCTACAGSMILEFGALSRLTGNPVFEEKAKNAMRALWSRRSADNLIGNVIHTHTGQWLREESGIGAGIDSYYEYLLKAYMLLGDAVYLDVFNTHYSAVMTHVKRGAWFIDTRMHQPYSANRNNLIVDALSAFWPGLQVLKGDVDAAKESHQMYFDVVKRFGFLPEGFTADHRAHWVHHPLRPEFIESTYYLYRATKDPLYLEIGRQVLEKIKSTARVNCGWAAIADVNTLRLEDRMDSFVLSETFKYLYLLFDSDRASGNRMEDDLTIDVENFVFTTEAHLLPLNLSTIAGRTTPFPEDDTIPRSSTHQQLSCPVFQVYDAHAAFTQFVLSGGLSPLWNICLPQEAPAVASEPTPPPWSGDASSINPSNPIHRNYLSLRGIDLQPSGDHFKVSFNPAQCVTTQLLMEGQALMQQIIGLSHAQQPAAQAAQAAHADSKDPTVDASDKLLRIIYPSDAQPHTFVVGPALFGPVLTSTSTVSGSLAIAKPFDGCRPLEQAERMKNRIVLVERGSCLFAHKVRTAAAVGAAAVVIIGIVADPSIVCVLRWCSHLTTNFF